MGAEFFVKNCMKPLVSQQVSRFSNRNEITRENNSSSVRFPGRGAKLPKEECAPRAA